MKMGKVICCLYVMPKTISYFPWALEGVKDFHTDFSCPNSKDILNLFLIFSSFPQGSAASLLWVLSAVLMRVSISIGKLHSAALCQPLTLLLLGYPLPGTYTCLISLLQHGSSHPIWAGPLMHLAESSFASPLQGLSHYLLIESPLP